MWLNLNRMSALFKDIMKIGLLLMKKKKKNGDMNALLEDNRNIIVSLTYNFTPHET